ncbi:MAG TPA: hypothetical protein VJ779_13125 [Acetobacteraceae bacterium]|nr:hypothetical protein [Acetobacteraceae bacterium]
MNLAVVGLVAAYVVVAVLLLSINLTSLWRWWVKAAAIVVTMSLFAVTYRGFHGLMGWPTTEKLPPRFSLVWTVITEPNKKGNNPGSIYLWVDALDANNVPSGRPRSYQLAYSRGLARKISSAQEKRDHGQEVMGVASNQQMPPDAQPRDNIKMGQIQPNKGDQNAATDTVPFMDDGSQINFADLPPVILPDKGPL